MDARKRRCSWAKLIARLLANCHGHVDDIVVSVRTSMVVLRQVVSHLAAPCSKGGGCLSGLKLSLVSVRSMVAAFTGIAPFLKAQPWLLSVLIALGENPDPLDRVGMSLRCHTLPIGADLEFLARRCSALSLCGGLSKAECSVDSKWWSVCPPIIFLQFCRVCGCSTTSLYHALGVCMSSCVVICTVVVALSIKPSKTVFMVK